MRLYRDYQIRDAMEEVEAKREAEHLKNAPFDELLEYVRSAVSKYGPYIFKICL